MGKASTRILLALTVVVVLVAVFQVRRQRSSDHGDMIAPRAFSQLDLAAVAEVRVAKGDESVTLRRGDGDHWGVEQRAGYPVDGERLRRLVFAMTQLQALDRLTENPEKYEAMGLGDPPAEGSVRLSDGDGQTLATLLLGNRREVRTGGSGGQFVRVDDDAAVYLVASVPVAEVDPVGWLDRTLVDLPADRVVRVEVTHPDGKGDFSAAREQPRDPLTLETSLPPGRAANSGALGDLGRALVNVTCDDVLSAGDPSVADLAFSTTFAASTSDGVAYAVSLAKRGESHYARVAASVQPAARAPDATEAEAGEGAPSNGEAPTEPVRPSMDTAEAVAEFNARHSGWTYPIPEYIYDRLAKTLDDLLAEEE